MNRRGNETILITGGAGNLGTKLIHQLLQRYPDIEIHCVDIIEPSIKSDRLVFHEVDIRSKQLSSILKSNKCRIVFHMVAIMSSKNLSESEVFDIEINGLKNILGASVDTGVEQFIFVSSGAVYGYKSGLPRYIPESQPLATSNIIKYGENKAIAEKLISSFCQHHDMKTTIFRPCSILGKNSNNIVSRWFDKKVIIGLNNTLTPFSFVWDDDLVECFIEAIEKRILGVYNVAAHGWVSLEEIASLQSKRYITFNKERLGRLIGFMNRLSLIEYKKEHLDFIKYRPVLNRNKMNSYFSYSFKKTSKQAFEQYLKFH
ncbi:NAD-dependent epimerase/dehydratase family protein [Crocinitomix catalasitica]|nr:NAD-dependent epimerase/dehydratase family protein [Crocinitomix catalasitica]